CLLSIVVELAACFFVSFNESCSFFRSWVQERLKNAGKLRRSPHLVQLSATALRCGGPLLRPVALHIGVGDLSVCCLQRLRLLRLQALSQLVNGLQLAAEALVGQVQVDLGPALDSQPVLQAGQGSLELVLRLFSARSGLGHLAAASAAASTSAALIPPVPPKLTRASGVRSTPTPIFFFLVSSSFGSQFDVNSSGKSLQCCMPAEADSVEPTRLHPPPRLQKCNRAGAQSAEVPSQTMLGKLKTAAKNRAPVFSTKQQQQQRWKPKNADVSSQASLVSKDSEKLPPLAQQPKRAAQQKQQQQKLHLPRNRCSASREAGGLKACQRYCNTSHVILAWLSRHMQTVSEEWRLADKTARKKFDFLLENVIGGDSVFVGPFGLRKLLYFDYVASGRSLRCIEDFIQSSVLPRYGNTHSSGSLVALQSNAYREEARRLIKKCVNAGPDDALIFTGSGATGAVQTLIGVLELQERRRRGEKLAVVHGPFEHHSNLLPWRELADVCTRTPLDSAGGVDMAAPASNVTGTVTDTASVTAMLHAYGAIAVWDYACAGPYVSVDMNPRGAKSGAFDALLLSPHKFVGGPGTPGVLVAKRHLFANRVPHRPGGGTVDFVTRDSHQYEADVETREEGGTPAYRVIEKREAELLRWAWQILPDMESVLLLGNRQQPRLPIFSFLVVNRETGLFLHHNFVAILLNDLYGVQSRAGCACAGPYASDLLEFDQQTQNRFPYLADGINRLKYCIDNYRR
uniref:Aminotran_5 domain-containing protein n=1 Tax=Macrostomum lignano TaxID=282301 RepID=A0A1I8IG06_9PLAT